MACGEGRSDFVWSSKRNGNTSTAGAAMLISGSGVAGVSSSTGGGGCTGVGWGLEFYDCILNNDLQRLEALVERHRIDLDAKFTAVRKKNHLDLSPIHLVAYKGYAGMLQYLHDMKCDIHLQTATLRRTAFHFAVLRHKAACFHKLLTFGAKPDARDTFGNTACHYAAEDGDVLLLDVLLRHPTVDPNAQDIASKTPLMKAARNGKLEAVKRLLAAGCSLTLRDRNGDSALHFAARHGNGRIVASLVAASNGDIINMQNVWGHTALLEAVCYSNKDAVGRLLDAGCDLTFREVKAGESALHVAVRKNYCGIADQLLASGAGLQPVFNYQGERAIFDAIVNQKLDTIRLFMRHNYNLDVPCKLDYDGSGGRLPIRVSLERDLHDVLRIFAACGYGFALTTPVFPGLLSANGYACSPVADCGNVLLPSSAGLSHGTPLKLMGVTRELMCAVRPLRSQCRRDIRRLIGFGLERKVGVLPLPASLRDYILLKDIFTD